jgi:hypothetical protein
MSCVICQEVMAPHVLADHVRVFHPEDEKELLGELAPSEQAFAA